MIIKSKEDIIEHFSKGNKTEQFIGVENEKFIFDKKSKKRSSYTQINKVLNFLSDNFGWKKIFEDENIIGLNLKDAQVTLEPGNQIELAGGKLNNIHEVCSESFKFQDQLMLACKKFDLDLLSIGYDPFTVANYKASTKNLISITFQWCIQTDSDDRIRCLRHYINK